MTLLAPSNPQWAANPNHLRWLIRAVQHDVDAPAGIPRMDLVVAIAERQIMGIVQRLLGCEGLPKCIPTLSSSHLSSNDVASRIERYIEHHLNLVTLLVSDGSRPASSPRVPRTSPGPTSTTSLDFRNFSCEDVTCTLSRV